MYGLFGKLLRINLTNRDITEEIIEPKIAENFLGSRGLGIYYLRSLLYGNDISSIDPLSPINPLIMVTGPLTGTIAPTGSRYMVITKSPLTNGIASSNSGGFFPTFLKRAGWDGIIFEGKSANPVYIWVNNENVEIRSAEFVWGKNVIESDKEIRLQTNPSAKTALIGPAGENKVLFASIMNDCHRAAGRSGVGAVMGSKNLKGVSVYGTNTIPIANKHGLKKSVSNILKKFKANFSDAPPPLRSYGTAVTVGVTQSYGVLPTNNFTKGTVDAWENIKGQTITKSILKKIGTCFSCPVGCKRITEVNDGKYNGSGEGPEYETVYSFGSNCGVSNLNAITKANYICNELGLDTITMGATIACAMELSENGFLDEKEVNIGRKLKFGDDSSLVELTILTAYRKGFGNLLADGSLRLAKRYNHPELAIVSKGLEFAGYDPRGSQGMGLGYATSSIGASHMRGGDPAYPELLSVPFLVDRNTCHDKPIIIKEWQDVFAVIDASGLCIFFAARNLVNQDLHIHPNVISELLTLVTGVNYSIDKLCKIGERITNIERLFLKEAGFSRKDDSLPKRITEEPLSDGPSKGMVCHLEDMLDKYYELRGWDSNGIPTAEKLKELDLI